MTQKRSPKASLLFTGIVTVLIGFLLQKYLGPKFGGDWPKVLYMGCYIYGIGSIFWALKSMS